MNFQRSREPLIAMSEDWCSDNRAMVLLTRHLKKNKKINHPIVFLVIAFKWRQIS